MFTFELSKCLKKSADASQTLGLLVSADLRTSPALTVGPSSC
jgi:hypothetical protein